MARVGLRRQPNRDVCWSTAGIRTKRRRRRRRRNIRQRGRGHERRRFITSIELCAFGWFHLWMHACVADATANDSETSFPKYVQSHRIHASCTTHTDTQIHIHGHTPFYTGERPSVLRFCSVFFRIKRGGDQIVSRDFHLRVLYFRSFVQVLLGREDGHASEKKENSHVHMYTYDYTDH